MCAISVSWLEEFAHLLIVSLSLAVLVGAYGLYKHWFPTVSDLLKRIEWRCVYFAVDHEHFLEDLEIFCDNDNGSMRYRHRALVRLRKQLNAVQQQLSQMPQQLKTLEANLKVMPGGASLHVHTRVAGFRKCFDEVTAEFADSDRFLTWLETNVARSIRLP